MNEREGAYDQFLDFELESNPTSLVLGCTSALANTPTPHLVVLVLHQPGATLLEMEARAMGAHSKMVVYRWASDYWAVRRETHVLRGFRSKWYNEG